MTAPAVFYVLDKSFANYKKEHIFPMQVQGDKKFERFTISECLFVYYKTEHFLFSGARSILVDFNVDHRGSGVGRRRGSSRRSDDLRLQRRHQRHQHHRQHDPGTNPYQT